MDLKISSGRKKNITCTHSPFDLLANQLWAADVCNINNSSWSLLLVMSQVQEDVTPPTQSKVKDPQSMHRPLSAAVCTAYICVQITGWLDDSENSLNYSEANSAVIHRLGFNNKSATICKWMKTLCLWENVACSVSLAAWGGLSLSVWRSHLSAGQRVPG